MDTFEFCNDQPGRLLAVFLFAPILILILFLWDLYHILYTKPNILI